MDKNLKEDLIILAGMFFFGPLLVVLGIIFLPTILVAALVFALWWILKKKKPFSTKVEIPKEAKPIKESIPKKPFTIKFMGKDITITQLILTIIGTILMVILFFLAVIFVIPPMFTIIILGFLIGKAIGKCTK